MGAPTVAIIGAGTAGICAARECLSRGLSVTIFDKRGVMGGLWSAEDTPVFDNLTTNTACFDTCISAVPPLRVSPKDPVPQHDNLCLSAKELRDYLRTVVRQTPGLDRAFRSRTHVVALREVDQGYLVESLPVGRGAAESNVERYDFVVVASGSFHHPTMPDIPGLETFPGAVLHVSNYYNLKLCDGKLVLVVGGSISGCEAIGDMAMGVEGEKPASITLSTRMMRYLVKKQEGVHIAIGELSNRFANLRMMAGQMWDDEFKKDCLEYVRRITKNEDYNAPPATHPIHVPGFPTWCIVHEKFLMASKERLMKWNVGGISRVNNDASVVFRDGSVESFDIILFATGYQLHLPFLDEKTSKLVVADEAPDHFMDLADHTFHPEKPRLAFIGLFASGAASAPIFDLQARYIARVFADPATRLSEEELYQQQEIYRKQRTSEKAHSIVFGCEILDRLAQISGFEVDLSVYKEWTRALLFGPMVPAQFRLFGEGKYEGALEDFEREMTAAGYKKGDNQMEEGHLRKLREVCDELIAQGKDQKGLRDAVDYLCQENGFEGMHEVATTK